MASYTVAILCPYCQSDAVVKNGKRYGHQVFKCKGCHKAFKNTGAVNGHKVPADHIGAAIQDYYAGKSYKAVAETMAKEYGIPEPSKATIYEWVRDYSEKAVDQMQGRKAIVGGEWVADEMQVRVGGEKVWLWNVMDGRSRYILACHLSKERDAKAAIETLRKATQAADKPPKHFFSDKLRSYLPALREVIPEANHYQSQGFDADINNNLSERLQGTYRDRIKTLRGLDNIESGQRYLDGWTLNYNLFRKHHSLRNRTPSHRAKVKPPFDSWADVVKGGTTPQIFPPDHIVAAPEASYDPKATLTLPGVPLAKCQPAQQSRQATETNPIPPTFAKTPKVTRSPRAKSPARRNPRTVKNHPFYNVRPQRAKARRKAR